MTELAKYCAEDGESIPTDEFCDLLDLIVLLLRGMGSLMSTAFSDVSEKSVAMRANKAFMMQQFGKDDELSLNEMIDEEIALGIV